MLALGAAAFSADHSRSVRARSLSALSQWPSLPLYPACAPEHVNFSSPKRTESGRIVRVALSSPSISCGGRARSWRAPWCCAARRKRTVADMPKGVTWFPGGLVPSTSGEVKSQPCAIGLKIMRICARLQESAFIPHFQQTKAFSTFTLHAFSVQYSLQFCKKNTIKNKKLIAFLVKHNLQQ